MSTGCVASRTRNGRTGVAQKAAVLSERAVACRIVHARPDVDGRGQSVALRHELVDDRADIRGFAARRELVAGQGIVRGLGMDGLVVRGGADDGVLVGHFGEQGQMFANLDAGHVGIDRLEDAAHVFRGVGLHVERVLMRRPAPQEHEDHRHFVVYFAGGKRLLRGEQTGQGQAEKARAADLQKLAPGRAVARLHRLMSKFYHACTPL